MNGSGGRRIVGVAGKAMNHQRTGFTPVPTHQDGATVSAFQFDRRIEYLQCGRRRGHRFNKRRWNDLESLFSKGGHVIGT